AQAGIQPLLNEQELAGGLTNDQVEQINQRLQGASLSDEVRRIKVWNRAGTVIYSDNPALIGRTFDIDDDLKEALEGNASASVTANRATQERLNRLKGQFLIRISHQFRTALVGIEGFSEVIRDSEQLDLEEVKAFATDIHNDAERLDQAFARMLTLDEMEAG